MFPYFCKHKIPKHHYIRQKRAQRFLYFISKILEVYQTYTEYSVGGKLFIPKI